jgi:hypothetical protein
LFFSISNLSEYTTELLGKYSNKSVQYSSPLNVLCLIEPSCWIDINLSSIEYFLTLNIFFGWLRIKLLSMKWSKSSISTLDKSYNDVSNCSNSSNENGVNSDDMIWFEWIHNS